LGNATFKWRMMSMATNNYYEILQISPTANHLLINKVYRVLAAMYHTDNQQTGDAERFREVCTAYETLSDPKRRKEYDLEVLGSAKPAEAHPRDALSDDDLPKPESQQDIRDLVVRVLYENRISDPHKPELQLQVLAAVIGVDPDDLEFARWYLLEKGYIRMSSSADFQITVAGVDYVESSLRARRDATDPGRAALPA